MGAAAYCTGAAAVTIGNEVVLIGAAITGEAAMVTAGMVAAADMVADMVKPLFCVPWGQARS